MSSRGSDSYIDKLHDETEHELQRASFLAQVGSAAASITSLVFSLDDNGSNSGNYKGCQAGTLNVKRKCQDMDSYLGEMNDRAFERRYRMSKTSFFGLLDIIKEHLPSMGERYGGGVLNGPISHVMRLSMAIRYCAGGDPLDIADVHGVCDREVLNSLWSVVDAINASKELDLVFPEMHVEQMLLAEAFKVKSEVGIDCCFAAIDGMLVWTNKPSSKDQHVHKIGPTKFFCGRKMKYGQHDNI